MESDILDGLLGPVINRLCSISVHGTKTR